MHNGNRQAPVPMSGAVLLDQNRVAVMQVLRNAYAFPGLIDVRTQNNLVERNVIFGMTKLEYAAIALGSGLQNFDSPEEVVKQAAALLDACAKHQASIDQAEAEAAQQVAANQS